MLSKKNINRRVVTGEGNPNAKIMIVSDAPSKIDASRGRPLTGYGGQILEQCLRMASISRSNCFITNVVKEAPFNGIHEFIKFDKKGDMTCSESYIQYVKILGEQIKELNPNVIIAMGNVALYTLTEKLGITKWRGSLLNSTLIPGMKVIPTFHPESAQRVYMNTYLIIQDLRKASAESETPALNYKPRQYILEPSFEDVMMFLDKMISDYNVHAFDIEVSSQEMSCISFAYNESLAISIPFIKGGINYWTPPKEEIIFRKIAEALSSPKHKSIAHNTSFDSTFLFRKYNIAPKNLHDTMIAQAILYPDFPKGLDFITTSYTDIPYYKDEGKDVIKGKITGTDRGFWLYNAKDSLVVMEAFPKMMRDLDVQGNLDTYNRQRSLLEPILFMTEYGLKFDVENARNHSIQLRREVEKLQHELNVIAGCNLNPNSPKQLKDYFYVKKKINPYKTKGKVTVDESALKRISRLGHKEASIIMDMRRNKKLDSTYLNMLLDEDNRIRSSMNPVGTKFGRLSSSKTIFGTGGNMQNIPPAAKKYILIDEGYVGYDIDLSQAENRVVAYMGPDKSMIEAFESGIDIHSKTASLVFGKPIDLVSRKKGSTSIGNGKYSERDIGKVSNHSLNYMMGFKSFAYHWEIAETDGKRIRDTYLKNYPGVPKMWKMIEDKLKTSRSLTNLMGRKCVFLGRFDDTMMKEACAFTPQSTVADKINQHGIIYVYNNQDKFRHVVLLNQVHDSIVIQIPKSVGWEYHAEVLLLIKQSLETPLSYHGREFIIPADIQMLVHNIKEGPELDRSKATNVDSMSKHLSEEYNKYLDTNGKAE